MKTLPRRPLTGLAIAFVAGTGLGLALPTNQIVLLFASAGCLAVVLFSILLSDAFGRAGVIPAKLVAGIKPALPVVPSPNSIMPAGVGEQRPSTIMVHTALLATVLGLGWANAVPPPGNTDQTIPSIISLPAGAGMVGIIADEPVCVSTRSGKSTWKFPVTVEQVRAGWSNGWQEATGTVRVRLFSTNGNRIPAYGERWAFSGYMAQTVFKQGRFAGKPGGVFFSGSAKKAWFKAGEAGNPFIAKCLTARVWAGKILSQGITDRPDQACILSSILLGYYSQIPRDLYQAFAKTGTLHVFAISGSHVVILGGIVIFILAAGGMSRMFWVLLLGPLLIFYTAMTGLDPSAVRACIMGIIYWMAPLIGRKSDIFTTLAASAILILAFAPGDLVNVGFLLSYVAVLGLVLFCPVFMAPLHRCFQPDPLKLEPDPRWKEMGREGWKLFSDLLAVSLAAWLATAPLTALFFGNFSPIGLPGNLVVVPLSSIVIITGAISLTMGSCFLFLADLFNHANLALITLMTEFTRWLAAIPGGCIKVSPPPIWAILLFYTILLAGRFAIAVVSEKPMASWIEGEE